MRPKLLLRRTAAFVFLWQVVVGQDGVTVSLNETIDETSPVPAPVPIDSTTTDAPAVDGTLSPPGTSPTLPPKPECFNNTDLLFDFMEAKEPFTPEDFILCPNLVYKLGVVLGPDNSCCLDGQSPMAARSNSRIMCGADGKLENNCTIVNGQFQVISTFFSFLEVDNNVVFQGITFEQSDFAGLLLENDGDVTFIDCALKKHSGIAPVIAAYDPEYIDPGRRLREAHRQLKDLTPRQRLAFVSQEHAKRLSGERNFYDRFLLDEEEELDEEQRDSLHRQLQVTPSYRMDITFDKLLFSNNERGTVGGNEKLGVITSEGTNEHFVVKNCLFEDNRYGDELDVRGYMIQISQDTSTLDIQNTCFVNNNVLGPGLIIVNGAESLTGNANISITADDDVTCQFVASETKDENGQVTGVACVKPAVSTTCQAPFDVPPDVVFIESAAGSTALSLLFNVLVLVVSALVL